MTQATAPGKVILLGEHAVVYHRPAIAVPVSQVQAEASLTPRDGDPREFWLTAPDLGRDYPLAEAAEDDPLAVTVRNTLAYLNAEPPAATLRITSTIPLGRGLGSGAAIATAIVKAVSAFLTGQALPPAEVSDLVYETEKLYHGTPSGIDNTVVAYEQPVYFLRTADAPRIERMRVAQPFTLVIGDTGISAATHEVVGDLRRRWQAELERYEGYFDEIEALVRHARLAIEQPAFMPAALGTLMNENQALLETVGVSSPELARLIAAAREAGALGAKLSGAGWGGNMLALVRPEQADAVRQALIAAGAAGVIVTTLAASA